MNVVLALLLSLLLTNLVSAIPGQAGSRSVSDNGVDTDSEVSVTDLYGALISDPEEIQYDPPECRDENGALYISVFCQSLYEHEALDLLLSLAYADTTADPDLRAVMDDKEFPNTLRLNHMAETACDHENAEDYFRATLDTVDPRFFELIESVIKKPIYRLSLMSDDDLIPDVPAKLLQFRVKLNPEHQYNQEFNDAVKEYAPNMPSLYSFHGSPIYNWFRILQDRLTIDLGVNFAYGRGLYSTLSYRTALEYFKARKRFSRWNKSLVLPADCQIFARLELVNARKNGLVYTSTSPHFVTKEDKFSRIRGLIIVPGKDNIYAVRTLGHYLEDETLA